MIADDQLVPMAPPPPKRKGAARTTTATTKRTPTIRSYAVAAGGTVDVLLEKGTVSFSIAVVDATGAAIAWTLGYESDPTNVRHFAATAAPYAEEQLGPRFGPEWLRIGAAAAGRVELIVWKA